MIKFLTPQQRHLIWKDEIGDSFILTKECELYRYNDRCCGIYFGWRSIPDELLDLVSNVDKSDDKIYRGQVLNENVPRFINHNPFKRRPNINGKWVKDKERRLGHKILPYRPIEFKTAQDGRAKKILNLKKK